MKIEKYEYPIDGGYADTVAILDDGRRLSINTQYACISIGHEQSEMVGCDAFVRMGGRCNCGKLAGIDQTALIADARKNGKFGRPEKVYKKTSTETYHDNHGVGYCAKCQSYCYGDCEADNG